MAKNELSHKEMRSIMRGMQRERERNEEAERKASNEIERVEIAKDRLENQYQEQYLSLDRKHFEIEKALAEVEHRYREAEYRNREAEIKEAQNLLQLKGIEIERKALEVYYNQRLNEVETQRLSVKREALEVYHDKRLNEVDRKEIGIDRKVLDVHHDKRSNEVERKALEVYHDKRNLEVEKKAFQLHIDESMFRLYQSKAVQELALERMKFEFVQMVYEKFKTLDKKEMELNFRDQDHRNKVAQHELNVISQNYKWENLQHEIKMRYEGLNLERKGLQQEQFKINLQKEYYANTETWGNLNYMMRLEQTQKFLKDDIQKLSGHLTHVLHANGYNNLNEFLVKSIESK